MAQLLWSRGQIQQCLFYNLIIATIKFIRLPDILSPSFLKHAPHKVKHFRISRLYFKVAYRWIVGPPKFVYRWIVPYLSISLNCTLNLHIFGLYLKFVYRWIVLSICIAYIWILL